MPEGLPCCTTWTLSHNPAHISQTFDVVYLHSCLRCCSPGDTASGPVSDVHVYLWACFFLPPIWVSVIISSFLFFLSPWLFFSLLFFLSPWCWKTLAPISNCSLAVCLFLSVFLVLLLLWREATGDPVWLQNCTEIRLIMALQKDLRQILRLCASFAHAHKHKHIPRKTPRLRHMDIYCRVKDVHIYVEMKRDCVLSYKCQLKCTRSPKWSSTQHTSG